MNYGTIDEPQKRPSNIPSKAQWLGGIGAGAYFWIELKENSYVVSRWDQFGHLDCAREMQIEPCNATFDIEQEFVFDYPCHCAEVNIKQDQKHFTLTWPTNENLIA